MQNQRNFSIHLRKSNPTNFHIFADLKKDFNIVYIILCVCVCVHILLVLIAAGSESINLFNAESIIYMLLYKYFIQQNSQHFFRNKKKLKTKKNKTK